MRLQAVPSWFVRVEQHREALLQATQETRWVPSYVKDKRFANWLASARDWAVSRSALQACDSRAATAAHSTAACTARRAIASLAAQPGQGQASCNRLASARD